MPDQEKTPKPAAKADVPAAPKPQTPLQDALDAKAERQKHEDKSKAEFDQLEKDGKLTEPTAIVGYEHARAQLGKPVEEAMADAKKAE